MLNSILNTRFQNYLDSALHTNIISKVQIGCKPNSRTSLIKNIQATRHSLVSTNEDEEK